MSEPILDLQPHHLCYDVVEYIIELCFDPYTPCVCSLVCKSWNKIVNVMRSRHQKQSEKAFNELYISRYKARQSLSLSQKNDIDRQLYKLLASQLDYRPRDFHPVAVKSLLDQGATTCLFYDHEGSTNLGEFVDRCFQFVELKKTRENGFKVLIDICCSYSREWCCNRRYAGNGGEWLPAFVLEMMASNATWLGRRALQGEEAIKMKRYVSMVLDSMRLSTIASKMVEPETTMFTGLDVHKLTSLISAFVLYITCPQSREERFMIRRFLSYALNAIDTLSKSKDFSSLMEDVLNAYMTENGYYTPNDWMGFEWIFKVFMKLGYSHLFYLITGRGYKDQTQGSVITMSVNWKDLLRSKDSRRVLTRFVETYKDMRLSILLTDNGAWWKMLVRDKNRHLLKRLHDLETESFNTSEILEYAKSKEVKGKKEHLVEMLEMLEIANK